MPRASELMAPVVRHGRLRAKSVFVLSELLHVTQQCWYDVRPMYWASLPKLDIVPACALSNATYATYALPASA